MKREEIKAWFQQLSSESITFPIDHFGRTGDEGSARAWATEAESALAAVFDESHPTRQSWSRVLKLPSAQDICVVFGKLRGVFEGAASLVLGDRLGSLIDSVRLESESELLDQATVLVDNNYVAAATVIAGGAWKLTCVTTSTSTAFLRVGTEVFPNTTVLLVRPENPTASCMRPTTASLSRLGEATETKRLTSQESSTGPRKTSDG